MRIAASLLVVAVLSACERPAEPSAPAAAPAPPAASVPPVAPQPAARPATPAATTITPDGLGPVRIGMSQAEALAALGDDWSLGGTMEPDDPGACRHIIAGGDEGGPLAYMLNQGRVTRVSVDVSGAQAAPPVRSERGVGLGSTEDDVRRAYGDQLRSEPHHYTEAPARYLTVWTRGGPTRDDEFVQSADARGIRFVTDERRRVVAIIAGDSTLQYVEGCS